MKRNEHHKAKSWRESHQLSVDQLSQLTGYSDKSIYWFERGETPPQRNAKGGNADDRRIKDWVWQRYKMACAGVQAGLKSGQGFDWGAP